jgi:glycosyltransferase involved in cell wall biosynthesis
VETNNKAFNINTASIEEIEKFTAQHTKTIAHKCTADPIVSICMITYNHKEYIAQAIESVLMQQTDFSYELVIGEDCSTDGTREIVIDYQKRYPDRIRVLLSTENLGKYTNNGRLNFIRCLNSCSGKYIALLDGDDFWLSKKKLNKQIFYLKNNPNCVICFHNAMVVYSNQKIKSHVFLKTKKELFDFDDVIEKWFMPTSSVVFKNGVINKFPKFYYTTKSGDIPLWIMIAEYGKIGYIEEAMSIYRKHRDSITYKNEHYGIKLYSERIELYNILNQYYGMKYDKKFKDAIRNFYVLLVIDHEESNVIITELMRYYKITNRKAFKKLLLIFFERFWRKIKNKNIKYFVEY